MHKDRPFRIYLPNRVTCKTRAKVLNTMSAFGRVEYFLWKKNYMEFFSNFDSQLQPDDFYPFLLIFASIRRSLVL